MSTSDVGNPAGDLARWGDQCRTGCATRDHLTYGECLRAANLHVDRDSLRVNDARGS